MSFYLEVYGFISAGNSLFTLLRAFTFAYAGIMAALVREIEPLWRADGYPQTIHSQLLQSVLKAPMKFFDTTPIGATGVM